MATLTDTLAAQEPVGGGARVALAVTEAERRAALAMLVDGGLHGTRQAVEQFLAFAGRRQLKLDQLWAAYPVDDNAHGSDSTRASASTHASDGGNLNDSADVAPLAAALLVPTAGRTAMVFASPITARATPAVLTRLLAQAVAAQDASQVRLAQCLLDPSQKREAAALEQVGFFRLAHLSYMQRPAGVAPPLGKTDGLAALPRDVEPVTWTEAQRPLFEQAVLASYEDTLDCPALRELRDIEDVIAGHQATGDFDPSLWMVLRSGDQTAGVLLANPVLDGAALEIVYIGLSPAWRGRGLGRALLQHALTAARAHGMNHLMLAVDELNAPAVRLYRSMRFVTTTRKLAMILSL